MPSHSSSAVWIIHQFPQLSCLTHVSTEGCYRSLALGGNILGYEHAADHLLQFLYKGGDIEYPPYTMYFGNIRLFRSDSSWIRYSPSVQSTIPLVDQDILYLVHWKARRGEMNGQVETTRRQVWPSKATEGDVYYAMNIFLLWAEANYWVQGCYQATVEATYRFFDRYDWHPGLPAGGPVPGLADFKDAWTQALQDARLGAPFDINGWWHDAKAFTFPYVWLELPFPLPPTSQQPPRR
jgi:hypothetical protein